MDKNFEKNKKVCLLILKRKSNYSHSLIRNFSNFYHVEVIFLHDMLSKNTNQMIFFLNEYIKNKNVFLSVFEGDYVSLISHDFINLINCQLKALLTLDDVDCHESNFITAKACDFVLSACPISTKKYRSKGIPAHLFTLESSDEIFKDYKVKKDIDVLFFGRKANDREVYINHIKKNKIFIKIVGWNGPNEVTDKQLGKLISRSKIVLNFSKASSKFKKYNKYNKESAIKDYRQLKGRIIQTGLCKTACVSEYSPAQKLLFNDKEVATFFNPNECVEIINKLLNDENLLRKYSENLYSIVIEKYETKKNIQEIQEYIKNIAFTKQESFKIPYWYLRFVNKRKIRTYFRNKSFKSFILEYIDIIQSGRKKISLIQIINSIEATLYLLIYILKFPFIYFILKK